MRHTASRTLLEQAKEVTTQADPDANDPLAGNTIFGSAYANAIYVGTTGTITISFPDGSTIDLVNHAVGQWVNHPPFKNIAFSVAADVVVGLTFKNG